MSDSTHEPAKNEIPTHDAVRPFTGGPACASSSLQGRGDEADPEIAALLDFEPVPRKTFQRGAWTPELQRLFIARLAVHGNVNKACDELNKDRGGVKKLYRSAEGESFRLAWDAAVELAERRGVAEPEKPPTIVTAAPPSLGWRRRRAAAPVQDGPLPGQVRNEFGQWEDEESLQRRTWEARSSIARKLLQARRLYLKEISPSAGHRAAFEILTELPIDWERAERLEPQPDEPWRHPNLRNPDMLLTAENGWLNEFTHSADKKAELRAAIDEYRAEEGLPPVQWDEAEGTNEPEEDDR